MTPPPPSPRSGPRARRAATVLALLLAFAPLPAHAVTISEFGTRCANGDPSGTFIELAGNNNESTRILTGLRALDRTGAVRFDMSDVYGQSGLTYVTWHEGNRRFLLMTAAGSARYTPDNVLPSSLDPEAGSIILYRVTSGRETVLHRVDYGTPAVSAPPPGTSMERVGGVWRFQPATRYNQFTSGGGGVTNECLGYAKFFVNELALACEDGDTRGQYLQLRVLGPSTKLDSRLRLRLFDHTGALIVEIADPFGANRDQPVLEGTTWLLGGPRFVSDGERSPDGLLPAEMDRIGGRIEVFGTFHGTNWISDTFTYGTPSLPAPPDGFALSRPLGSTTSVRLPNPVNALGRNVLVPECAAGTAVPRLFVNELALQCMDGRTQGQFVELGVRGAPLPLDAPFHLRAHRRDGSLAFEVRDVFGGLGVPTLARDRTVLLVLDGHPAGAQADGLLPDTLDPLAGRVEIVREGANGDSVSATLAWGDPPLARPPAGSSLDGSTALPGLVAYPTPRSHAGQSFPAPGCLARDVPVTFQLDEVGFECVDGSRAAAFVELGGLAPDFVRDRTLGLRLESASGGELARVFPLFPARARWPDTEAATWLVAAPGFEAITALAPDATWTAEPAGSPGRVAVFRRHPLTGAESLVGWMSVPGTLLAPGRSLVRLPDGQYEMSAVATPRRLEGETATASPCWSLPYPERARIRAVLLGCRDGDAAGQYVELEATSGETPYSPDLVLRVRDRDGHVLGETRRPYPAGYMDLGWHRERHLLVAGPAFAARTGQAPDALLPAALDRVAGRIELLLLPADGPAILLDALDYGTPAMATPPDGASLERVEGEWTVIDSPAPTGITAALAAPTSCLGKCPPRTVQFGFGAPQAIPDLAATMSAVGSGFEYDTRAGTFQLDSEFRELTVLWSDHFRVEGVAPGAPLPLTVRLRTLASVRDSCAAVRCDASRASMVLASAAGSDSASVQADPRRDLTLALTPEPGGHFELGLRLRARAATSLVLPATVRARLEFQGLPEGARVVSCHGFDSRAQRKLGAPEVTVAERQASIRWPVQGPPGLAARVERREGDGEWSVIVPRVEEHDGSLAIVDPRVVPRRRYEYRALWNDEFGEYAGPVARAEPQAALAFRFEGVRPNPSTGALAAALELPQSGRVRFEVLDVSGRLVVERESVLEAGRHSVLLTGEGALAPGVYVVRLTWGGRETTQANVVVLR